MKKIILGVLLSTYLFSLPITTVLDVKGMTCASGCAPKVNKAMLGINGVESCNVNFDESKATVVYDNDKVTESEILSSLALNPTFKFALNKSCKSSKDTNCSKTCSSKTKQIEKKSILQRLFGF